MQNMCPISTKYLDSQYLQAISNIPVQIDGVTKKRIIKKAKKVLALQRKGVKVILPNVLKIECELLKDQAK